MKLINSRIANAVGRRFDPVSDYYLAYFKFVEAGDVFGRYYLRLGALNATVD